MLTAPLLEAEHQLHFSLAEMQLARNLFHGIALASQVQHLLLGRGAPGVSDGGSRFLFVPLPRRRHGTLQDDCPQSAR